VGVSDLRVVLSRRDRGEVSAVLAFEMFLARLHQAIGSAAATLGGIDTLIFTATAAERNAELRSLIVAPLGYLGLTIDPFHNERVICRNGHLSPDGAPARILLSCTDEMGEMARLTNAFFESETL
jgi:acetate kinase